MTNHGVDPLILKAWASARSVARSLAAPVPEFGGFRVDTRSDVEIARWIFPAIGPGLEALARSITNPRHFLKLCGTPEQLRAALPPGWLLNAPCHFMEATTTPAARRLADGYHVKTRRSDKVIAVRIVSASGALAASGYAAEAEGVLVYDRIVTQPEHRRKGLGHVLMRTLHDASGHSSGPAFLVATDDGRALYSTLGCKTISPYSTASIPTH